MTAGQSASITLGLAQAGTEGTTVHWQVVPIPGGVTVTPSSGTFTEAQAPGSAGVAEGCRPTTPSTQTLSVTVPAAGSALLRVNLSASGGIKLPPVVVDLKVQP